MFAGSFKYSGGIIDLVETFDSLIQKKDYSHIKLLLIGDGECYPIVKKFIKKPYLSNKLILKGRISHHELAIYQEIADVIVCPDKNHPLSEMVPHIKYFDALISNKIVINGSFKSIKKINPNECFSINFKPSDKEDLLRKLDYVINNLDLLNIRYSFNKYRVCKEFTYSKSTKNLLNFDNC